MEFIEAMKTRERMCKANDCVNCPLEKRNGIFCRDYILNHPEEAEEILTKWAEEHPVKTMLQDFLEKHPNAPLDDDGTPQDVCPFALGYVKNKECYFDDGNDCIPCWNRPLED